MMDRAVASIDLDELVEHWTVLEGERTLVDAKRGATRLGFALLLKFYGRHGRFPSGGSELPGELVEFVAQQLRAAPADLGSYDWIGRSIERHRAQIREHFGFRECTVADAGQLTAWLAERVAQAERRPALVRDELLARCRSERIEPPAPGRIDRVVRSALRAGEETLSSRVASRLGGESKECIAALAAVDDATATDDDAENEPSDDRERPVLPKLKEAAGSVSLETMLTEIDKLLAVRAIGIGPGVFGDIAPSIVAAWRSGRWSSRRRICARRGVAYGPRRRAVARAGAGAHRHARGPADLDRAQGRRARREEGDQRARQRLQARQR
jgi:hypothetical protein